MPKPSGTKLKRVHEKILANIKSGVFPPGSRLPPETQLPKMLKAGKQTVVRVLNDLVREGRIVRRRGSGTYVADAKVPPLMVGRHLRLGLLWWRSVLPERMDDNFQADMTRGVLAELGLDAVQPEWAKAHEGEERKDTLVSWTLTPRGATVVALGESRQSRERHPSLDAIRAGRFDGLLTFSIIEEDWVESLLALGIPTILVDFPNERFALKADQVYVDPQPGYRAAVRHLAQKGLKRIHFIGGLVGKGAPSPEMGHEDFLAYIKGKARIDPDSFLRLGAFRQGMQECGLPVPEESIHLNYEHASALARQLAALPEAQRPEAVVCHGLTEAETMLRHFSERGWPMQAVGATHKPYTGEALAVRIDGRELGRAAAELLVWRLQKPERSVLRVGVPMVLQR